MAGSKSRDIPGRWCCHPHNHSCIQSHFYFTVLVKWLYQTLPRYKLLKYSFMIEVLYGIPRRENAKCSVMCNNCFEFSGFDSCLTTFPLTTICVNVVGLCFRNQNGGTYVLVRVMSQSVRRSCM